jgi:hypothetical protein
MTVVQQPIEPSVLTELKLQKAIHRTWGFGRELGIGNIYLFGDNESDYVTLTKAGYTDEYEIKLSRSDFRADQKKDRHERYQIVTPWRFVRGYAARTNAYTMVDHVGIAPQYPNRFWYVVPEGLVTVDEVPSYAGLVYASDRGFGHVSLEVKRQAPKLHGHKLPEGKVKKIIRSGYHRFIERWYMGRDETNGEDER